jgi:hypothetical protein
MDAKYTRLLVWYYKTRVPIIIAVLTVLIWIFLINLLMRSKSIWLILRDISS